ncbi:MAG: replicase [Cressdnaviricota sp.]|nr:MAG: replicase [Cressdnaviricota sp.]
MKFRDYSIVIHNVRSDVTPLTNDFVKTLNCKKYVSSVEPYPSSEGHHLHVFIYLNNQVTFKSLLKKLKLFSKTIITDPPAISKGEHGRVELDRLKGSWEQATAYLMNPKKDKPLGEVFILEEAAYGRGDVTCFRCETRFDKQLLLGLPSTVPLCHRCEFKNRLKDAQTHEEVMKHCEWYIMVDRLYKRYMK